MSKIQTNNFFDISHNIIEYQDKTGAWHYSLKRFANGSLKLYLTVCHFANRYSLKTPYLNDAKLGRVTGLSPRQLCRARVTLKKLGLIKTHKKVGLALVYEIIITPKMA